MSNARDKANIPALNFSSTGIDDNADSTVITLTNAEDMIVGTAPDRTSNLSQSSGNVQIENGLIFDSGSSSIDNQIMTYRTNSLVFATSATERMRINSTGLGIGTSSPSQLLHVYSTGNDIARIETNQTEGRLSLKDATGEAVLKFRNDYRFTNSSGELARLNSSGNLGIGTSSPSTSLHISQSVPIITLTDTDTSVSHQLSGQSGSRHLNLKVDTGGSSGSPVFNLSMQDSIKLSVLNDGNVGIGTTSPGTTLDVNGTIGVTSGNSYRFGNNTNYRIEGSNVTNPRIGFITNASERMRIDSNGDVMINTTSVIDAGRLSINAPQNDNGIGIEVDNAGGGNTGIVIDRTASDGDLISFVQAGTLEGKITVSGSTVSYGGFTGTHWSRFIDNSKPTILKGTVLESLDEMCDWYNLEFDVTTTTQDEDGNDVTNTVTEKIPHVLTDTQSNGDVITYNHDGTDYQATIVKEGDIKHMKSKVSDTVDAKNVYGVFNSWDEDGEGYNDFYVASVGSFVVRIKQGETVAKGDLLQSNGDGTAKVQTDDAVRSSSFAKVLSTTIIETYEDGSYLVPCSLMC